MEERPRIEPEVVLAHAAWMRALARNLLDDPAAADDVVQDAALAALQHSPADEAALVPWLSRVVRNFAWRRRRGEARRLDREARVAVRERDPTPAETLERLDLQQTVVEVLRTIDEPLRTTLVLRYFESLSSAEIARVQGVPAGTVRWRLKRGLDELRERFDKRFGSRADWVAAFAPFALREAVTVGAAATGSSGVLKGVLAMSGAQVTLATAAAALMIGGLWWGLSGSGARATTDAAPLPRSEVVETRRDEPLAEPEVARAAVVATPEPARSEGPAAAQAEAPAAVPAPAQPAIAHVDARFVDAHGAPWSGVALSAYVKWLDATAPVPSALSGADGRVELAVVLDARKVMTRDALSWSYDLVASRSGCAAVKLQATLHVGETVHLGDVVLNAGVRVSGHVVGEDGRALEGATIGVATGELDGDVGRMHRKGAKAFDATMSTRSASDGTFVIDGVAPGTQRLWAHADGMRYGWTESLAIPSDRDLEDIEVRLVPLVVTDRIEGRVVTPDGAPLADVDVMFQAHGPSQPTFLSTFLHTDQGGRFGLLTDYDDSLYDFTALNQGEYAGAAVADVPAGTLDLEIRMHVQRVASVHVHDAEGRPIDGAHFNVELQVSTSPAPAQSSGDGRYSVLVPDDPFHLGVSAHGFRSTRTGEWAPATMPAVLDVVLQRAPIVRGRVVAAGQPVANARVLLLKDDADARGTVNDMRCVCMFMRHFETVPTDEQGRFELDCDFDRALWIRAMADGWTPGEVGPIDVAQLREDASFEVELTHGGAIEGRVLLPDGRDGEGAIVALNHGDGLPRTLRAGPKGAFRAEGLTPGKWQVLARDAEIDPGTTTYGSTRASGPIAWSCEVAAGRTTHFDLDLTAK